MNRQQADKKTFVSLQQNTQHPLPVLEKRKVSMDHNNTYAVQKRKTTFKEKKFCEDSNIKRSNQDLSEEFSIRKVNQIRKKIVVSHKGKQQKIRIIQTLLPLKQQLQKLKGKFSFYRRQSLNDIDPFSVALKQILDYKEQPKSKQLLKMNKRSPKKIYRNLKPLYDSGIQKYELDFLSIQKINILQNQPKVNVKKNISHPSIDNTSDNNKFYTLNYIGNPQEQSAKKQFVQNKGKGEVIIIRESKMQIAGMRKTQSKLEFNCNEGSDNFIKFAKCIEIHQPNKNNQKNSQPTNRQKIKRETSISLFQYKKKKVFNPPFQTYFYRDLIWKVNFTNRITVQTPFQYEHRLKAYIGKGNNSGLVRGLIKRRIWFAITDKIQQANFLWTQLKNIQYFNTQPKGTTRQLVLRPDHYLQKGILTEMDQKLFNNYMETHCTVQQKTNERLQGRLKFLKGERLIKTNEIRQTKMHNHLINNYVIGNKKALFYTMLNYYNQINEEVFNYLPLTFHVKNGLEDEQYLKFSKFYYKRLKEAVEGKKIKNAWIVKPGQNSNRGQGIQVCFNIEEIKTILRKKEKYADGTEKTYIVQSYIERPLLYKKRKFDLRHYILMTSVNGYIKGYWYEDGYVRTTSSEYSLNDNSGKIHLTNDAVQKLLPEYGKYQKGNKIGYQQLQLYIEKNHKISFFQKIYPKMKKVATDAMRACSGTIDPDKKHQNFQIFGLDFMIDWEFNLWLIQINSNPCLQLSCPLLGGIIPKMLQNALQLTIDAAFPPPVRYAPKGVHYFKNLEQQNKFNLVYDERIQKNYQCSRNVIDAKMLEEEDDVFEDDGDQWNQDD